MLEFEVPAEAKAIREKVRKFVHDECIPAEKELDSKGFDNVLAALRRKARAQGLWNPFVPKEYGGMGLGPVANAVVQMELGESMLGALSMNTQGPDDASIMTILAHGTDYQKEKFLKPLLNGEKRICFSMTEKASGADATGMQTRAVKDGNENYVLNGEKWFSSSATVANMALVLAMTDPEAPRQEHGDRRSLLRPDPWRPFRDRDQGPEGLGAEPARWRGQRLQHGPASPRLWPAASWHAQHRQGAARARHGGGPRHQPLDLRAAACRPPGGAVH